MCSEKGLNSQTQALAEAGSDHMSSAAVQTVEPCYKQIHRHVPFKKQRCRVTVDMGIKQGHQQPLHWT